MTASAGGFQTGAEIAREAAKRCPGKGCYQEGELTTHGPDRWRKCTNTACRVGLYRERQPSEVVP